MTNFIQAIWFPLFLCFYCLLLLVVSLHEGDWYVFCMASILIFIFAVDVVGRASEYFYLKKFYNRRHKLLYWKIFQSSRCAREVMIAIDEEALEYYKQQGYKWYHFIPDDPGKIFSISFWKNLLKNRKNYLK